MIEIKCCGRITDGSCYVIQSGKIKILLDCGVSEKKFRKYHMSSKKEITACFITSDRAKNYKRLYEMAKMKCPFYIPQKVYDEKIKEMEEKKRKRLNIIEENKIYIFDKLKIYVMKLENKGGVQSFGFIFQDDEDLVLFIKDFSSLKVKNSIINWKFTKIYIEVNYIGRLLEISMQSYLSGKKNELLEKINSQNGLENAIFYLSKFNLQNCKRIVCINLDPMLTDIPYIKNEVVTNYAIPTFCLDLCGHER